MERASSKILRTKNGFTLMELIIVVAILGIIAMVAIPKFDAILANSKTKADDAALEILVKAANLYYINEMQSYATVPSDLIIKLKQLGYIENNPKDNNLIRRPSIGVDLNVNITSDGKGNHTIMWVEPTP